MFGTVSRAPQSHQRPVLGFYLGHVEELYLTGVLVEDVDGAVHVQLVVLQGQSALRTLLTDLVQGPSDVTLDNVSTSLANLISFSLFFKIFLGKSSLMRIPVPARRLAFASTAFLSYTRT